MRVLGRCALLLVTIYLAGCGSSTAPQPPAGQTAAPVEATAQPLEATSVVTEAPAAVTAPATLAAPAEATPTVDINCTETNPHPIGQGIAKTYQTSYEEVMTFFCTGVPFEDIGLAYQTAEIAKVDVKEVMTLWYDYDKNWDDVWTELGIQ